MRLKEKLVSVFVGSAISPIPNTPLFSLEC
jgi:hypothetical protein